MEKPQKSNCALRKVIKYGIMKFTFKFLKKEISSSTLNDY